MDRYFARHASSHSTIKAEPVQVDDWWARRHREILARNKQGPVDLLLIGDSITHGWEGQGELWQKYFVPRHAVNLGFSGDQTQHVLWRLRHGELAGISPKLAAIMIGTNNSNGDEFTAEQIADGITAICQEIRQRLPRTKILLLAIFPRGEKPDAQRAKNARASTIAARLADGKKIFYLDINDKFLKPDGTLTLDIMPDLLHPNTKGYQIWAEAMMPKVDELMGR